MRRYWLTALGWVCPGFPTLPGPSVLLTEAGLFLTAEDGGLLNA